MLTPRRPACDLQCTSKHVRSVDVGDRLPDMELRTAGGEPAPLSARWFSYSAAGRASAMQAMVPASVASSGARRVGSRVTSVMPTAAGAKDLGELGGHGGFVQQGAVGVFADEEFPPSGYLH